MVNLTTLIPTPDHNTITLRYFKPDALWGLKLGHSNQKWDRYAVIMRKNDDSKLEICQIKSKSNQC